MSNIIKLGKCQIQNCNNYISWHWQLTIDDDNPFVFMPIGCFYRGFTAINICDKHREKIKNGNSVIFKYKGKLYQFKDRNISEYKKI
jgi:hypothetical protein